MATSSGAGGAGGLVGEDSVHHRQVVAERLAGGGRSDDHHILACENGFQSARLVGVELVYAALAHHAHQALVERGGEVGVATGPRGGYPVGGNVTAEVLVAFQLVEELQYIHSASI